MDHTLTVRDLLLPGEPLDAAEVVAGEAHLSNPVTWVVSLRPYPPAFPRLRGGELALVAAEHLARLEPPTTLAAVVLYLASRDMAGVAVRGEIGEIDEASVKAAEECGLPLLRLEPDAALHDIEQEVMRVCALYQARREMVPRPEGTLDPGAWVDDLLAGSIGTLVEARAAARRQGIRLAEGYAVVVVGTRVEGQGTRVKAQDFERETWDFELEALNKVGVGVIVREWEDQLVALVPPEELEKVVGALAGSGLPCGVGGEKPVLDVRESLEEARLAALGSALLYGGRAARYEEMGADRLLVLMRRDHPDELRAFVERTIGAVLRYDEGSATPVLPTLWAFVEHGGRLREAAAAMYVHRNTLAYRLGKVEEILGVDLRDAKARLAIELALRALPLVGDV